MSKTAGELAAQASSDTSKYDAYEVGASLCADIMEQLEECSRRHNKIFDEDEYCIVSVIAKDPLIHNLIRRKYYGWLYLPKPRPNQSVFLYNKNSDTFRKLWVLPNAETMAYLSTMITVDKPWQTMKSWSDAFFDGTFHEYIRKQHGIDMLSEAEYLKVNREKLVQAGSDGSDAFTAKTFNPVQPSIK